MKIVITTIPFLPQPGGMEVSGALLAGALTRLGCQVKVATMTPSRQKDEYPYEVIREPSWLDLMRLYRWTDVYLQHGPSLKFGWPAFLGRKPSVIVHHVWMNEGSSFPTLTRPLRLAMVKRVRNFAVSDAVGKSLPVPAVTTPVPYDDTLFRVLPDVPRDRDLIFLGRLDPAKGVDVFIDALGILKAKGCELLATIAGSGPLKEELERKVGRLALSRSVRFSGYVPAEELTPLLNRHKVMVAPSLWDEPYGAVALEGIACGCAMIGSSGGGLPEAIGACGVTFPNGDAPALAKTIESLLAEPDRIHAYQKNAERHLADHRPDVVGRRYLQLLESN